MSEANTNVSGSVPSEWSTFVEPFAKATGKSAEELAQALKPLIGEPNAEAIALLSNEAHTSFDEIKATLSDVPLAKLRKAVNDHLRRKTATEPTPTTGMTGGGPALDVLPVPPGDAEWLTAIKAGGDLRVDQPTIVSAIRAAVGSRVGLFDVPKLLNERMEAHAEAMEEPVGAEYYKLRKLIVQRGGYAEIFAALEIEGGSFMTQARKDALLGKLDEILWPELIGFQHQLEAWAGSWQQGMANPAALFGAIAAMSAGGRQALPPGMLQPPATDGLRDAAESVIQRINKIFAGLGIPVARALALDAHRIKEILETPSLPAQVGAPNREQMLKMLGVAVPSDYVRLERNVTRYALGVLELQRVTSGSEELQFLTALMMLGSQIPWDKLGVPARRPQGSMRGGAGASSTGRNS